MRTEITKSHLNNHICQHRGIKTSTVTPSFNYVFNISLYCYDTIPSFIGNLWRVLLLENHLKRPKPRVAFATWYTGPCASKESRVLHFSQATPFNGCDSVMFVFLALPVSIFRRKLPNDFVLFVSDFVKAKVI